MTDTALIALIDDYWQKAVEMFVEVGGVEPLLFGIREGSVKVVIPAYIDNEESRTFAWTQMAWLLRHKRCDSYIFVSEVWFGTENGGRPSKDPNRREGLIVTGVTREGSMSHSAYIEGEERTLGARTDGEWVPASDRDGLALWLLHVVIEPDVYAAFEQLHEMMAAHEKSAGVKEISLKKHLLGSTASTVH